MGRYRKVDPKIWNDSKFRNLSDNGKLVFLFVLTHPHMTSLGAMRATIEGLGSELGWTTKGFRDAFTEGLSEGLFQYDEKASFLDVPKFLRYNKPESANVVKSWAKQWDDIPECELKSLLYQRVKGFTEGFGEGFRKAFGKTIHEFTEHPSLNQEHEHEHEHEQEQDIKNPTDSLSVGTDAKKLLLAEKRFIELWNSMDGTVKVRGESFTKTRRTAFRARLKEKNWPKDAKLALAKFPLECFQDSAKPWKPDVDWFFRPDTVTRILEGKYDWNKNKQADEPKPQSDLPYLDD